jgi:predicted DNA-binding transcriptional regulator AlpA
VCVSPNTFDRMVEDGRMPRAKRLGDRRIAWDVRELDVAVDQLPAEEAGSDDETWSDIDAPQTSAIR